MSTLGIVLLFILGLLLIIKGGDIFVDAASWMAVKSGIPKFIIGATIVSLATTLPELLVSVIAAIQGKSLLLVDEIAAHGKIDIAIGNAVGSVTANTGLIMAISILFMPAVVERRQFTVKAVLLVTAALILVLFGFGGSFYQVPNLLLVALFGLFIAENILSARQSMGRPDALEAAPTDPDPDSEPSDCITRLFEAVFANETLRNIAKFVLGAAGIVWGADLLVDNGTHLAHALHIPESIIGVTMIAIGTSLPELITTITAIRKHESSLSIGNILGANIIDLTLIMPIGSLLSGMALTVSRQSMYLDLPACALISMVAVIPAYVNRKFTRTQGFVMLGLYVVYLALVTIGVVS